MTRIMRHERFSATPALRAFSLIELTMVLTIMGIVAAMAVPRYAAFLSRSHLSAATTRIGADLELVRRTAKQTGASQTVTFNTVSDSYAVTGRNSMDRKSIAHLVQLSQEPYMAQIVSTTFVGEALTFNGYGEPEAGGSVLIQVGRFQQQIDVTAGTGSGVIKIVPSVEVQ